MLEAIVLADRIRQMLQPQAEREFQIIGYANVIGSIHAQLIQRDRLLRLQREILHDKGAGVRARTTYTTRCKSVECQRQNKWRCKHKILVRDVVTPVVPAHAERVPSAHPAEIIDKLILSDSAPLGHEEAVSIQSAKRAVVH